MPKDPEIRAKEIHEAIKHQFTKDKTTTAVLNTEQEAVIVGTNELRLRKEQREILFENEIEATGFGHAEVKVIQKAEELNLTATEIGVSRPICEACEIVVKEKNIATNTKFKSEL